MATVVEVCCLFLVALLWGGTNPFLKKGTEGIEKVKSRNIVIQLFAEVKFLFLNYKKCTECGNGQHLKRNYQGNGEQTPAIKSCSEDRLIEKRGSPTNGRKSSQKTMNCDDDCELQSDHGQCKVHHIRCYNCGRRKSKQEDDCCGDKCSYSHRCVKEKTDEHYFDSRINDAPSKHLQEKSLFAWNNANPENQTGRAWIRQSSSLLPYDWEDDCEMVDWVIDQYVQDDHSIAAFYKGKIIQTLNDALGITSETANSENLPKTLQNQLLDTNIPDIPKLCSESVVSDCQPAEELPEIESLKPLNSRPPSPCSSPPVLSDIALPPVEPDISQPAEEDQDCKKNPEECD
ncbi:transmembrane protein 234 isoform X1 [Chiloscyllium punctatum]|uniref:transmembrane protein 234 isoform X1 n=1 Tax=Chiloscyllium punctatum TaxID=137246 RepID=UPI003B63406B